MNCRKMLASIVFLCCTSQCVQAQGFFRFFSSANRSVQCPPVQCPPIECKPYQVDPCNPCAPLYCATNYFPCGECDTGFVQSQNTMGPQEKRELERIREKLDKIQPYEDPSLNQLKEDLDDIKKLLQSQASVSDSDLKKLAVVLNNISAYVKQRSSVSVEKVKNAGVEKARLSPKSVVFKASQSILVVD